MLYYTTVQDLKDRLGDSLYNELTDRDGGGQGDDSIAEQILQEAEAEVHAWLVGRYTCPIDVSSDTVLAQLLKSRVVQIAPFVSHAHAIRKDIPKSWESQHRMAMQWLKAVAAGDVPLTGETAPTAAEQGKAVSDVVGPDQVITGGNIGNF